MTDMLIEDAEAIMRANVKSGDIFAFSGSGLPSQMVKFATQSEYVHVAIVVWVDRRAVQNHAILLAESHIDVSLPSVGSGKRRLGVQFQWLTDRLASNPGPIWWIPLEPPLDPAAIVKLRQWLQMTEAAQTPYDFKQAIGIGLVAMGWSGLSQSDDHAFFCSELVIRSLQVAGVVDPALNAATCSPVNVIDLPCFGTPILVKAKGVGA
jgi:hypothetical protein